MIYTISSAQRGMGKHPRNSNKGHRELIGPRGTGHVLHMTNAVVAVPQCPLSIFHPETSMT